MTGVRLYICSKGSIKKAQCQSFLIVFIIISIMNNYRYVLRIPHSTCLSDLILLVDFSYQVKL
jgi:hypothetical protein